MSVSLSFVFGTVDSFASSTSAADLISGAPQEVPVKGTVTMIDLGAHKCIPCKMMAPVIKELSVEYEGRAAIVFIDVWENSNVPQQFGIRAIPTQIFYDAQGKEQYRHEGFMDKQSVVKVLQRLGVR
ncbi:thioredoxin family protein [Maridesulfovibrio zosterae]|uniref:thioredoxin family protein n=1 Tax=Maridesulfovibrio zosterae TaxID=82171 RepID=UPI000484A087|nr:thioredoxin family protein [Maridesulfovibrio zosterae]